MRVPVLLCAAARTPASVSTKRTLRPSTTSSGKKITKSAAQPGNSSRFVSQPTCRKGRLRMRTSWPGGLASIAARIAPSVRSVSARAESW
jgi:hypothetical protein